MIADRLEGHGVVGHQAVLDDELFLFAQAFEGAVPRVPQELA